MGLFFTSDWHLTDKGKDSYRWEIFDWIKRQVVNRNGKAVFILGDITDAKNHHSNELINRIVDELRSLAKLCPVHILAGNHDASEPSAPLFRFLKEPNLQFYYEPTSIKVEKTKILMMPNERSATLFKQKLYASKAEEHDFVLMHQTFKGSIVSNGTEMPGFNPDFGSVKTTKWISGDVHVPQVIGQVTYCGAPHPVHFGDTFSPRVLFWDGTTLKSIPRTTTRKKVVSVSSIKEFLANDIIPGDHVKVIYSLSHEDFHTWEERKADLEALSAKDGWKLFGFEVATLEKEKPLAGRVTKEVASPETVLSLFCEKNNIDGELAALGKKLLHDTTN